MGKRILAQLEKIAYWLQRKYMQAKLTEELIRPGWAFFHPQDKSEQILNLYQIKLAKLAGKKIVLVTGCFDVLHEEHFKFLKKAKKEGDVLVVGLEADKRVTQMKGEGRPINSFTTRAKNLLRLIEVDFVLKLPVTFNKKSVRLRFLSLLEADILALSSQDPKESIKRKEVQTVNGQVKIVHQYNPRVSTTKLLDRT